MELIPGYKQTEVGVIPEDWTVVSFQQLLEFRNGINADRHAYGKGVAFINVFEIISKGHLKVQDIPGRVSIDKKSIESYRVRRGDIVFNRSSETQDEVGLSSVYLDDVPAVFGGFVIRGQCKQALDPIYSGYAFRAPAIRTQIVARGQGAIRANIGQSDLKQVHAPLPSLDEQRAIAEALSDADALVESLDQLIAKKRQIKQGAMQELLTGTRRLPGFSEEWEAKRLSELADIRSGGTPSTTQPQFWDGDVMWCTPTDITALNGFKYLRNTSRAISAEGLKASSAEIIPTHSVLMTSRATIGECAINTVPMTTNQGFKNFVPFDSVDTEFLYYLLTTQRAGFIGLCSGSTFLEIGKTQLSGYQVQVPKTKPEQTAIATVLSDMDTEIAALETRLAKARQIKQGMMQELLTGRIRLL